MNGMMFFISLSSALRCWIDDQRYQITAEERVISVEAMLWRIAEEFQRWPDDWKHKHYFGLPLVRPQCSCGCCPHEVESYARCIECNPWLGYAIRSVYGLSLIRRDVQ